MIVVRMKVNPTSNEVISLSVIATLPLSALARFAFLLQLMWPLEAYTLMMSNSLSTLTRQLNTRHTCTVQGEQRGPARLETS